MYSTVQIKFPWAPSPAMSLMAGTRLPYGKGIVVPLVDLLNSIYQMF